MGVKFLFVAYGADPAFSCALSSFRGRARSQKGKRQNQENDFKSIVPFHKTRCSTISQTRRPMMITITPMEKKKVLLAAKARLASSSGERGASSSSISMSSSSNLIINSYLVFDLRTGAWEWLGVADVVNSGEIHEQTIESNTESRMDAAAVFAEVEIPF